MGLSINNTRHAAADTVLLDVAGREVLMVAVKATFRWTPDGAVVDTPAVALEPLDRFRGEPRVSSLAAASEMTLPKPHVDVLLEGHIQLAAPAEKVEVTLSIGTRLAKTVRVWGPRHWTAGFVRDIVPSGPRAFDTLELAWELAWGGTDPGDPGVVEPRNPAGRGVRKKAGDLLGQPAPQFEDPAKPVTQAGGKAAPAGFGPIAPHWQPRVAHAGTYDSAYRENRHPLLPRDFDPRYFNAAPPDQQLPTYEPGEEVRLVDFTPARRERFRLPKLDVPVSFVDRGRIHELPARVDTIVIRPELRTMSLVARAVYTPERAITDVTAAYVGALTAGQRRSLATGKTYVRWRDGT